jgi:hypothetical protein
MDSYLNLQLVDRINQPSLKSFGAARRIYKIFPCHFSGRKMAKSIAFGEDDSINLPEFCITMI